MCDAELPEPGLHLDIGFAFNRDREDSVIWDCAAALEGDQQESARTAAKVWLGATAPPILSVLAQAPVGQTTFLNNDVAFGVPNWEVAAGPCLITSAPDSSKSVEVLTAFAEDARLLNRIASSFASSFERPFLHGVKIFYASNGVMECRVDGVRHEEASAALEKLAWPKVTEHVVLRSFALLIARTDR